MELFTEYQQYIINMINDMNNSNTNLIAPLHIDVLYSLRTNPIRFHDFKRIIHYYSGQNLIIQKYLIEPKFIYGNNEYERNILMSTLYKNYKMKYNKEPPLHQKLMYKDYIYILEKPISISSESETFILPLSLLINLILISESQKEFNEKYNEELNKLSINNQTSQFSLSNYIIPQNLPNYDTVIKILSKGYKHSWCLLIEYVINNIQFLSNTKTIPKTLKYKNENIGIIFSNLCKQLSVNSQYRPFKYDFIEIINGLGLQFNDININDLITATQYKMNI